MTTVNPIDDLQPTHPTTPAVTDPSQLIPRVSEAWARHDADAFAGLFTEDGTMTLPGFTLGSRQEIREFLTSAYAGPFNGTRVVGNPVRVRMLSDTVVLVQTIGGIVPSGSEELPADREVNASWLAVREPDSWRLAAYHNSPRH